MATTKVSDALARPARTAIQGGAGLIETEFIDAFIYNLNDQQYGVLVVVLTVLSGWVQVIFENRFKKALLREVPEPDQPVIDK